MLSFRCKNIKPKAAAWRSSLKKVFLNFLQNLHENTYNGVIILKNLQMQPY